MLSLLAAAVLASPATFEVRSGTGLTVSVGGVPVVRGSWFQYYERGWTRGYYSSRWNTQTIDRGADGSYVVRFTGADGQATGTHTFTPTPTGLRARYEFRWSGPNPVMVELCAGMLWAPAFQGGTLTAGGETRRDLATPLAAGRDPESRRLAPRTGAFSFAAPWGNTELRGTGDWLLFDARAGYPQDWAEDTQLFWLGQTDIEVKPGEPTVRELEFVFAPKPALAPAVASPGVRNVPTVVQLPETGRLPLVPKPKDNRLSESQSVRLGRRTDGGPAALRAELQRALDTRFEDPRASDGVPVRLSVRDQGLPPQGYTLTGGPAGIEVVGQDAEGLRLGTRRLALLAFRDSEGRVAVPQGQLRDWPSVGWRGVHLFVGPTANAFHDRLWSRVLLPLGFNRAVLQCEATSWDAIPNTQTPLTMRKSDLVRLFAQYRERGVDPIPLIQSFGHMQWLFANGQNRELAFDPQNPWQIDPRKEPARRKVAQIWNEAIDALRPKTIHVGLDEVDLRSMPNDPQLVTDLWRIQVPFLNRLAQERGVEMMLWSDKMLAPGEAIDATHGHDPAQARLRREVLRPGTWVADWHYRDDPNPDGFRRSLRLWKDAGMRPIASAWYRPGNVRGFALAAAEEGAGFLQTTWAGYESRESAMVENFRQFSAMVLAADYTWSARTESPDAVGYDPAELFRQLYIGDRSLARPLQRTALVWGDGPEVRIGPYRFASGEPIRLRSVVTAAGASRPTEATLPFNLTGRRFLVALGAEVPGDEGDVVGEAVAELEDGRTVRTPIVYGRMVRATSDVAATPLGPRQNGLTAWQWEIGPDARRVVRITVRATNPVTGLSVHGVSAL